ncbi:hypothetical protein P0D75_39560 [Paraburkholderia sediminicola]|uniref:hypothetical protein n=1 Tax=Paraburkholderia sediminicola TaxID=458836 RepID=UPI0038B6B76F
MMKEFFLLIVAIAIWVAIWRLAAKHWRRKGWNAVVSHLSAGVSGLAISIIFLAVILPAKPTPSGDTAIASTPASTKHEETTSAPAVTAPTSVSAVGETNADTSLPPGVHKIADGTWLGCESDKLHSKLTSYSVAGDKAAFKKAVLMAISNGECTLFRTGETVQLMDTAIFRGMVQLRRLGDTTEYWTNIEATSSKK